MNFSLIIRKRTVCMRCCCRSMGIFGTMGVSGRVAVTVEEAEFSLLICLLDAGVRGCEMSAGDIPAVSDVCTERFRRPGDFSATIDPRKRQYTITSTKRGRAHLWLWSELPTGGNVQVRCNRSRCAWFTCLQHRRSVLMQFLLQLISLKVTGKNNRLTLLNIAWCIEIMIFGLVNYLVRKRPIAAPTREDSFDSVMESHMRFERFSI